MFWMSCRVPILLTCLWCTVNGAVSISPKNEFPMKGESFTLTCTNTNPSNNINWGLEYAGSSSVLTTCIASTDNTCLPIRTGYTFTSDVSNNTFNMQIDSVSLSNCGIYTCNDATTFDSDPLTVNISDINTAKSSLNLSEPVEKTDGQVSVETDCLTPMSAISSQRCTYYTKEGVEYETCENVTPTSSSTGCTDTCNGEAWAKVTVQYQYTQATKNRVEGNLRVRIKHTGDSNHPREIVWNSTNIQWVEGPKVPSTTSTSYTPTNTTTNMPTGTSTSNSSDNRLSDGAIGGIVGGLSSLILVATAVTIYCCRKHNGQKKQKNIGVQLENQDNKM